MKKPEHLKNSKVRLHLNIDIRKEKEYSVYLWLNAGKTNIALW